MATAATLPSSQPSANRRIFNILQSAMKVSQELKQCLESAAEAFQGKSYKTAAKYYKNTLDLWTAKDEMAQSQNIVLVKYMLCMCWLESTDAKDLLDSLKNLEELERSYGYEYPMLYYAVGKAYFKLYRFNKAGEIVKKGFSVLNGDIKLVEYNIPGTNTIIPESSRERLVAFLVTLNEQCSSWHRPDAVCCMPDCSNYSSNEGADKNIFYGSPTFNGVVLVTCNNTSNFCMMSFHSACWKAKKEQLGSLGKMSDKDVLNCECFTPNCENQGVRCTIRKIEIYDENAEVKASIEPRADDVVWHAKSNPQPKGAVRKQQHTNKVKIPSEPRATPYERPARPQPLPNNPPNHNNTSAHRLKVEENEEDDDIHDEQALKASVEKLIELRAKNFGIVDEEIWRPDLEMYGNGYMLTTAEFIPDPDFMDEGVEEADLKAFFFSYFYSFISESGPVKLDDLDEKWNEAKSITANCDSVLKHYLDITEFLLQSVKFAVVGDYICVAEKLPSAYDLTKNDTCEILRFFLENDVDRRSNSSSFDDEAAFNDLINQEKNNNSLPYSSVSGDAEVVVKESTDPNPPTNTDSKDDEEIIAESRNNSEIVASTPSASPKIQKSQSLPKCDSDVQENEDAQEVVEASETVEEKKFTENHAPFHSLTEKSPLKRARTAEYSNFGYSKTLEETTESNDVNKDVKKLELIANAITGTRKTAFDSTAFSPATFNFGIEKVAQPFDTKFKFSLGAEKHKKESKSTEDLRASVANIGNAVMNNSAEPVKWLDGPKKRHFWSSPTRSNGVETSENNLAESAEPECKQDSSLVAELVDEMHKMATELGDYKRKAESLESELEHVKKAHAAMRIRMLQRSLHSQYAYNHGTIVMKIEECRKNIEVYNGIQTMLIKSIGQKLPSTGSEWVKPMTELEQILKNHQTKFWELNERLCTTKDPEKLKEVSLQLEALPELPQIKLTDVIQAAFEMYRMHQMSEFQRLPMVHPQPQPQQQQQMFGSPQYRPPISDYYTGSQFLQGSSVGLGFHAPQLNFMRPLVPQNVRMQTLRSPPPANPLPLNIQLNRNYPHSLQSFPYFPPPLQPQQQQQQQPSQPMYQTVNPSVQQMQQISSPAPASQQQQHVFSAPPQKTSENVAQRNNSPVAQNPPQSPNVATAERAKIAAAKASPSSVPASPVFSNSGQQNGQSSDQNSAKLPSSPSASPRRPNSAAELDARQTSEDIVAKLNQRPLSFVAAGLPAVSAQELQTTRKKSPNVVRHGNFEGFAVKNTQRANSAPEIAKIFAAQGTAAKTPQENNKDCENKENVEGPKIVTENTDKQPLLGNKKNGIAAAAAANHQQQNSKSNILQAPTLFRDADNADSRKNIDAHVSELSSDCSKPAKSEGSNKTAEKCNDESGCVVSSIPEPKQEKLQKKPEHSMDKLMRKMRQKYTGVLELDLLKGVECVRKKHNNSLSRIPITRIIREADRFIVDRQQMQLCGYGKRPTNQNQYFAVSNSAPWCPPEGERKRQNSVSSTSSGNSLKKEPQQWSSKKKWEPVVIPNDTWHRETLESDCAICLESMINTSSYTLQCKHTFHKLCIKNWYQHNQSCPTCRVHSTIDDEYPPLPLG